MNGISLKKFIPHIAAVGIFILLSIGYFYPQLSGKKITQGDYLSFEQVSKEIKDHHEKTGEWTKWTNAMFGGMPTYQIHSPATTNLTIKLKRALYLGIPRPAGLFIFGMICFYIMGLCLGVNPWLAIIGAIAFSFTTNNLVLYEAGHMTKLDCLMSMPLVIAGVITTFRNKRILGFILFATGMAFNIGSNHPQMTYYLGLLLLIYTFIVFIDAIKNKTFPDFVKNGLLLLLGVFLALGTSASKLWTTYEYSKDTMRGKPILTQTGDVTSSSQVDGLAYDYATQWSNGWSDLLSSYIPHVVGGGSAEEMPSGSKFGKELRKVGMKKGPMYWGALPFTSGPVYFGAIMFFLFFLSLGFLDGKMKIWAMLSLALTLLLSLGHNFDVLYRMFFELFPLFNKFRTPNSILSVTAVIIPMVGIMSLDAMMKKDTEDLDFKKVLIPGAVLAGLALLILLVGGSMFDFTSAGDQRFASAGLNTKLLEADRQSMMNSSILRTIVFIAFAIALLWLHFKNRLDSKLVILGLGLLMIFDLFGIGKRYVSADDFVAERKYGQTFEMRPVDKQIKADPDPHYRVLDLSINTFNSAASSYHHKTIGGYHAAKLQRIQDMIDRHISQNNPAAMNMLNTKYIIGQGGNGQLGVQQNPDALGNAWFVEDIKMVANANEEIDAINGLDPDSIAIVNKEFSDYINNLNPSKNGTIKLLTYAPNELIYTSNTNSEQLAVFSEVWYGPDKGWQAYIDDQPVDHIRANYLLRAMKIPAGEHEIRFEFQPKSFSVGSTISLICSLILFLLIGVAGYSYFRKSKELSKA